jgi:hypothetical protein
MSGVVIEDNKPSFTASEEILRFIVFVFVIVVTT